jgi:methylmalonyl-CoA/ethylmalonyl-CoA epimerase
VIPDSAINAIHVIIAVLAPVDNDSRFAITPPSKIELLEATNEDSPIAKYLERRGQGIHHIAFDVENIDAEIERLIGEGFQLIQSTPKNGADNKLIAFLHPKSTEGILVELCQEKS